jgi:hypothetical protein
VAEFADRPDPDHSRHSGAWLSPRRDRCSADEQSAPLRGRWR